MTASCKALTSLKQYWQKQTLRSASSEGSARKWASLFSCQKHSFEASFLKQMTTLLFRQCPLTQYNCIYRAPSSEEMENDDGKCPAKNAPFHRVLSRHTTLSLCYPPCNCIALKAAAKALQLESPGANPLSSLPCSAWLPVSLEMIILSLQTYTVSLMPHIMLLTLIQAASKLAVMQNADISDMLMDRAVLNEANLK